MNTELDLVYIKESFDSKESLLAFMADNLVQRGYAKPSFKEAILKRESMYPTGLAVEPINIAIPHTDTEHVNKSVVSILKLNESVNFIHMATDDQCVPVNLVLMLAVADGGNHLEGLSRLMQAISEEDKVRALFEPTDVKKIKENFESLYV